MGAFTGKTVLILGGSRGIGAAIVRRFVTDGANVETLSLMSFVRVAHWIFW